MTAQDANLPLVARAAAHADRIAVAGPEGTFHYRDLLDASAAVAVRLLAGAGDLHEARVAFLVPPGFTYVAVQWGIWRAGGVAAPPAAPNPPAELRLHVGDSGFVRGGRRPQLAGRPRPIAEGPATCRSC